MEREPRVALVTGGAVRVGRAIALALAEHEWSVAITFLSSADEAQETLADLLAAGAPSAAAVRCDQRDPVQVREAVREAERRIGPPDLLVNSAAIFRRTPVQSATLEDWDEHLEVNLRGPWLFAQAVSPGMRDRGHGVILNLLDIAVERPYAGYLPYVASKAGLEALTRGLAVALAPEVRVNGIAPGTVLWPDDYPEEEKRHVLDRTPLGRAGTPEDVAAAVVFLAEGSDFISGAILPVDGGRRLR